MQLDDNSLVLFAMPNVEIQKNYLYESSLLCDIWMEYHKWRLPEKCLKYLGK